MGAQQYGRTHIDNERFVQISALAVCPHAADRGEEYLYGAYARYFMSRESRKAE